MITVHNNNVLQRKFSNLPCPNVRRSIAISNMMSFLFLKVKDIIDTTFDYFETIFIRSSESGLVMLVTDVTETTDKVSFVYLGINSEKILVITYENYCTMHPLTCVDDILDKKRVYSIILCEYPNDKKPDPLLIKLYLWLDKVMTIEKYYLA